VTAYPAAHPGLNDGHFHPDALEQGHARSLSKLARVVELFARDLQVQEQLEPKGVGVVLEAEHLCMSMRGVQEFGATTVTSTLLGQVRDDPRTRQEFLALTTKAEP